MLVWRPIFLADLSAVLLASVLVLACGLFSGQTARASSRVARTISQQTVNFSAIDFLSDDNICGFADNGKLKCFDWNMEAVSLPDSITGFATVSDVMVSDLGICGFDVDGLKCIREDRKKVKLRELIQESVRGSVVAYGHNACGVSAANGTLRCLVSEWPSYSRHSFRIQPRLKITAIGISESNICWADDGLINCQSDSETRSVKFANPDTIISSPYLCARNKSEAKCWLGPLEVVLAPEFLNAKKWFSDTYATVGAITDDNRFISADIMTGMIDTTGSRHVPAAFEQPNGPLADIWSSDYMHFCAVGRLEAFATCWSGYSSTTTAVQFSAPVLGLLQGRAMPCALLQTGQIECADEYYRGPRSLPAAGTTHARIYQNQPCLWNDKAIDCGGQNNLGPVDKISLVETNESQSSLCAIVNRSGSANTDVVCRPNTELESVPKATEGATGLSVATDKACAISPVGLTCWGQPFAGEAQPSSLLGPVKVKLTDVAACALDSFGLVCWGDLDARGMKIPSGLNGAGAVIDFALGKSRVCAVLQNGTLQCWGNKGAEDEDPPQLTGVTAIYGSRQHVFCALNASGLHCWGGDTKFPR